MARLTGAIAYSGSPEREGFAKAMRRECPTLIVVTDPGYESNDPAWRCERLAWKAYGENATHHLVLEDDAILCKNFGMAVTMAVSAWGHQDVILSFYSPRKAVRDALDAGEHWASYGHSFLNCQAVVMPVGLIDRFVAFGDLDDASTYAPDIRIRDFADRENIPVMMSCPSLVQHGLPSNSLLPRHNNKGRVASCFIGLTDDALSIDWTKGVPRARADDRTRAA